MVWYSSDTVMALHRAKRADMRSQRVTSKARSAEIRRRYEVVLDRRRSVVAV